MKVEILNVGDHGESVSISDEGLDNDNFVEIVIKVEDDEDLESTVSYAVSLTELKAAVDAFDQMRTRRLKNESLMKE